MNEKEVVMNEKILVVDDEENIRYLLLDEALEAFPVVISKVDGPVVLPTELGVHNYDLTFNKNP
jgi:CheY-like chemotaxis protein